MEPLVLFEQSNPYATRVAQLESDGRAVYLYLSPVDDLPGQTNAVWVQNLLEAPDATDSESMKKGNAPLLKKSACNHPSGKPLPEKNDIDLIWFPEGSGVSLYINGQVEAIVPPFAGQNGIHGYARECKEYDCGTMPFPDSQAFFSRLQENMDFWTRRSEKNNWPAFRDKLLTHFESIYGTHTQYFALSRTYPPMAIVEFNTPDEFHDDERIYCSLGMSYQAMPGIENYNADYNTTSRMEFITLGSSDFKDLPGLLGRIAIYPWLSGKSFQDAHRYKSGMDIQNDAYLFTHDFSYSKILKPENFQTDDAYSINFLNAVNVNQETLLIAQSRGVEAALSSFLK